MVYKKYIKRGGKFYGPYNYKSRKNGGRVITEYLGKHEEHFVKKLYVFTVIWLIFSLGFAMMNFIFQPQISLSPNSSSFDGSTTDFDLEYNITNVSNAILEITSSGKIEFGAQNLDFTNADLDSYVFIKDKLIGIDTNNLPNLNTPATITFYNINYLSPRILVDGIACGACSILDYSGGNLIVNVLGFSNYTVGTESFLGIWDETDTGMPYGDQIKYPNDNVISFANYSNSTSGLLISGANCQIDFGTGFVTMTYNPATDLYENISSFTSAGTYPYNISCSATGYDTLETSDGVLLTAQTETCSEGAISSNCDCGGTNYSVGYCCNTANDPVWFDPYYTTCPLQYFYVDQNDPSASDSNLGGESDPWLTVTPALQNLIAGDVALIKQGTYYEGDESLHAYTPSYNPASSGTAENPIVFKSYPGHDVSLTAYHAIIGADQRDNIVWDGFRVYATTDWTTIERPVITNYASNIIVINSELIGRNDDEGGQNHAGVRTQDSQGIIIRNNIIYGFTGWDSAGIELYWTTDSVFEHNEIYNSDFGIYPKGGDNSGRNTFRYNKIYNVLMGFKVGYGTAVGGPGGDRTYQNIIYDCIPPPYPPYGSGLLLTGGGGWRHNDTNFFNNVIYNCNYGIYSGWPTDNLDFFNNIFYTTSEIYHIENGAGYLSDYNTFYDYNSIILEGVVSATTLNEWQTQTGQDLNSDELDPLFVDVAGRDFHLDPSSPARDAGLDKWDLDNDGQTTDFINRGAYITGDEIIGVDPLGVPSPLLPVPGLPSYSKFDGSTTDFDSASNITNVTNAVLEITGSGKIEFGSAGLDFSNLDLDSYVFVKDKLIGIDTNNLPGLNVLTTITFYNIGFANPRVLRDGIDCGACNIVDYTGGNLIVNVPGFSNYTVGANAFLEIWDETDMGMPYGDQIKYVDNNTRFFANYTNSSSGSTILGATCEIDFGFGFTGMIYNTTTTFYENTSSFASAGTYPYTVDCSATGFDTLSLSDDVVILDVPMPPVIVLNTPSDGATGLLSSVSFTANITESILDIVKFSLYHDIFGSWVLNQTKYPELPNNQLDDTFNGIDMTGNVLLYHLNNDSAFGENGTHFYDFSGNQNNATAHHFDGDEIVSGKFDKAVSFDGTNDGIIVLDSASLDSATGTNQPRAYGYWIIPGTAINRLITDKAGFTGRHFWSEQQVSRTINGGIASVENTMTTGALTNEWHFIVFTYNGTHESLYVDGVLVDGPDAVNGLADDTSNLLIGSDANGGYPVNGMLDELFIFNRYLSATEIARMYNVTKDYHVNFTLDNIPDGTYEWNVKAFDNTSASAFAPSNFGFSVGAGVGDNPPTINLNFPPDAYITDQTTITFNATVSDDNGILNVSLFIDGILDEVNNSGINNEEYLFTKTFTDATYTWYYRACDTIVQCTNSATRIFTVNTTQPPSCQLTNAYWSTATATEGQTITLTVEGTNCDTKEINFTIREDDLFGGDDWPITQPNNVFFSGSTSTGTWTAEYQPDGFLGINDPPEYYFIATLVENVSETMQSSDPKLEVNKLYTNNEIFVDPVSQTVDQGNIFTIEIKGRAPITASDVYAVQYDIEYNPSMLSVDSIIEGPLLSDNWQDTTLFNYTLTSGKIDNIYNSRNVTNGSSNIGIYTDEGIFAIINFTAIGTGISQININELIWINSSITNESVGIPSVIATNGSVDVQSTANTPPLISNILCNIGGLWLGCDTSIYGGIIQEVRADCTDTDGTVQSVQFVLHNTQDNIDLIDGTETSGVGDTYTYDVNPDLIIEDSGDMTLTVTCIDNDSASDIDNVPWNIGFGSLSVSLVNPITDTNVTQNQFFPFTTNVTCVGGECGNINAILDPAVSYFYDFESGEQEWTHAPVSVGVDQWHLSTETAHDGLYSWKAGDTGTGNYVDRIDSELVTPVFELGQNSVLEFYHYLNTETSWDPAKLEYSLDSGSWVKVENVMFIEGGYISGCSIGQGSPSGFTTGEDVWAGNIGGPSAFQRVRVNISSLTGANISFRFRFGTDYSTEYEGWYIDAFNFTTETTETIGGAKGAVSTTPGDIPFYTTDNNPQLCSDMKQGDPACQTTWQVNATGNISESYEFFVDYDAVYSDVTDAETQHINITIVSQGAPVDNPPTINLNFPPDAYITNQTTITFNATVSDDNGILNVSLFIGGVLNDTDSSGINNAGYLFTESFADETPTWHSWYYRACDTIVQCTNSATRIFTVNTTTPVTCVDSDLDDYGVCPDCDVVNGCGFDGNDCDDTNSSINPGATEVCDGVDNDCANGIDDGFTDESCSFVCETSGFDWSGNGGSLNCCGNNANEDSPYELIETLCDGNDNNCDGSIDEGLLTTYYQDFDIDNYGNNSVTQDSCTQPAGFVVDNTDCNDTNSSINPGATEVCNGVDDNCIDGVDENNGDCSGGTPYCVLGSCVECEFDSQCDDLAFCNGVETCSAGVCGSGTPPTCDDGISCTFDFCNITLDACDTNVSGCGCPGGFDSECDDGLWCNGAETCNTATLICESGTAPDCNDTIGCTNDGCNETSDTCDNIADDSLCFSDTECADYYCDLALDCQVNYNLSTDICRDSQGGCDIIEYCTGSSPNCSSDSYQLLGTECRGVAGLCDVAESCDGVSVGCPIDAYADSSTICRSSLWVCDLDDYCTGFDINCPSDAKSTSVCRNATDECDAEEVCDGINNDCPADLSQSAGTRCGLERDCPLDSCSGFFAQFFPDDGNDTCDGFGGCVVYSCALENSYCTDNDPGDAWDGLFCGASCDENSDCGSGFECDLLACSCIESQCAGQSDGTSCDDGIFCNGPDQCFSQVCNNIGPAETCDDSNSCTDDICNPGSDLCENNLIDADSSQACCEQINYAWIAGSGDLNCCGDDLNEDAPFELIVELSCSDGNDNDCDGDIDINDSDCIVTPSCGLTDAYWSLNNTIDGDSVDLIVIDDNCNGKEINFIVIEDDGFGIGNDYPNTQPDNVIILNTTATGVWTAEYQPDGIGGINDPPEYYFIATLVENVSETIQSSNQLEVFESDALVFDNLRNFTHMINTAFSESITASDASGIDTYVLNDTSVFAVNSSTGLITNTTELSSTQIYWLTIIVNDTLGNQNTGEFFINIVNDSTPPLVTINSPTQGQSFTSADVTLDITTDEESVCNYIFDSGATNYTMTPNPANTQFTSTQSLANGDYVFQFYCWDLVGNLNNTESVGFSVSVTTSDTGGNGGGGGGSQRTSFSLDKEQISVSLEQGQDTVKEFIVTNDGTTSLSFIVSSDLEEIIELVTTEFSLIKRESQTVWMNLITQENTALNVYIGHVKVKASGIEKEALVSIEVVSRGSLFDLVLEIPEEDLVIMPGEEMEINLSLTRLFGIPGDNVTLNYIIKDEEGNEVFFEKRDRVIGTSLSFIKILDVPGGLDFGKYILYVQVEYQDKIASASTWFDVGTEEKAIKLLEWLRPNLWRIVILASTITIIFVILIIYFKKKREEKMIQQGMAITSYS